MPSTNILSFLTLFQGVHYIFFLVMIAAYISLFYPFPKKPWFSRVCSTSLLKTLCEKEKLLVKLLMTSNFSFSHTVFNPLEYILPIPSNFQLTSANSLALEQSKSLHIKRTSLCVYCQHGQSMLS